MDILGDMTAVTCICIASSYECCICTGLIQTNRNYAELAAVSSVDLLITDHSFQKFLGSSCEESLSEEELKNAKEHSLMLPDGKRLSSHEITGGMVYWREDVSELQKVILELREQSEDLEEKEMLLRRENEVRKRTAVLSEQNRLYNMLIEQMTPVLEIYQETIEKAENCTDEEETKRLIAYLGITGAYVKRRCNLFLIHRVEEHISAQELYFSLKESLENLRLLGVPCQCSFRIEKAMSYGQMVKLYKFYQKIVMGCMNSLEGLFVSVVEEDDMPVMKLRVLYEGEIPLPSDEGIQAVKEDEEWIVSCRAEDGNEI